MSDINEYRYFLIDFCLRNNVYSDVRIKRDINLTIKRFISCDSYRGLRHTLGLSVRGQRTRTNSGTQRRKYILNKKK